MGRIQDLCRVGRRPRVSIETVKMRIQRGFPPEQAMALPAGIRSGVGRFSQVVMAWGEEKTLAEWERDARAVVPAGVMRARLALGYTPEQAVSLPLSARLPR